MNRLLVIAFFLLRCWLLRGATRPCLRWRGAAASSERRRAPAAEAVVPPEPAVIPQAFPRDRYEASWKKNPFLLKVAVIAQVKESWATDYALTSIAKMSGIYRVSIKNKKTGREQEADRGSRCRCGVQDRDG